MRLYVLMSTITHSAQMAFASSALLTVLPFKTHTQHTNTHRGGHRRWPGAGVQRRDPGDEQRMRVLHRCVCVLCDEKNNGCVCAACEAAEAQEHTLDVVALQFVALTNLCLSHSAWRPHPHLEETAEAQEHAGWSDCGDHWPRQPWARDPDLLRG